MQIEAKQLRNTLKILSGVVKENKISPALEGVLINKTSITGGNDVLTIKLPFENDLPECLLEFETLLKMANSLNGLLEVKQGAKVIEFKGSNGKISVPVIEGEYPLINPENKHKEFSLTYDEVKEIGKLSAFIETNGKYAGIYYDGISFAATNGYSSGYYNKLTDKSVKISVYPDVIKSLLPIGADQFDFKNSGILAVKDGKIIAEIKYLQLQEHSPDFQAVLPKNMPISATGTSYDFKQLLSILSISANKFLNIAAFNWFPFSLKGNATDPANNKESDCEIEIDANGLEEPLRIGLNIKYFENCVNFIDSESITVEMQAHNRVLLITGLDASKTCLLMPSLL